LSTGAYKRYADLVLLLATKGIKTVNIHDLQENQVDIFLVNVWDILPPEVLSRAKLGALNIHPSKLPTYRGALPTLWSLKNHDNLSAISYIVLNNKMDTGGILKQYPFDIENSDNYLDIEKKIDKLTSQTICEVVLNYFDGLIVPIKQEHLGTVSYTGKYEVYKKINWTEETSSEIFNKIGLYPYLEYGVFCYTYINERFVEIKKIKIEETRRNKLPPGHFILKGIRVYVGSKDGTMSFSPLNCLPIFLKRKGIFSN
jgi:methionyl-tRNA formyltransferase